MRSSLLDLVLAVANGESLAGAPAIAWDDAHSVTTVVAASGYPEAPVAGTVLEMPPEPPGVHAFHAGTRIGAGNTLIAAGGRVLAVTGVAPTLPDAARKSREYAQSVQLDGKHFRGDIGWREMTRGARAS
jgi:phosphoribosylamine--glycine ligase